MLFNPQKKNKNLYFKKISLNNKKQILKKWLKLKQSHKNKQQNKEIEADFELEERTTCW